MFIRKKANKSGAISVQIIDKSSGRYRMLKTVGSSDKPEEVTSLLLQGREMISELQMQGSFNFNINEERRLVDLFFKGIEELRLVGPELLLGKLFDEIGFCQVKDKMFRHLVLARLSFPASKLKTTDYLFKYYGRTY